MNVIYQFDESIETQRAQRKCSFHALKHVADNAIMCRSFATCTTVEEISSILLGNEGDSVLGRHVRATLGLICSSEGHRDVTTEVAKPVTPSHC